MALDPDLLSAFAQGIKGYMQGKMDREEFEGKKLDREYKRMELAAQIEGKKEAKKRQRLVDEYTFRQKGFLVEPEDGDFYSGKIVQDPNYIDPNKAYKDMQALYLQAQIDQMPGLAAIKQRQLDLLAGKQKSAEELARERLLLDRDRLAQDADIAREKMRSLEGMNKSKIAAKKSSSGSKPIKFTEGQYLAAGFAKRMAAAENKFKSLMESGFQPTAGKGAIEGLSIMPEGLKSGPIKQYEQIKRDFISAVLRKESGAAISPKEYREEEKKYFPQWGDDKKTIEQKALSRAQALENLKFASGGAYDLIPTGSPLKINAPQGSGPGGKMSYEEWVKAGRPK